MFGSGKQKEEQLRLQEAEQEWNRKRVHIESANTQSGKALESLSREQGSFHQELGQVVSQIRELRKEETAKGEKGKKARQHLEKLQQSLEQGETARQDAAGKLRNQQELLSQMEEQNKDAASPIQSLDKVCQGLEGQLGEMDAHLALLGEHGSTMGLLSLNAAIEAGRMGEDGQKFVEAAENVRSCAGACLQETQELSDGLEGIKEQLGEIKEQLAHLEGLLRDSSQNTEQLRLGYEAYADSLGEELIPQGADTLEKLEESLHQGTADEAKLDSRFLEVLQSMEKAQESFSCQQELVAQLGEKQVEIQSAIMEKKE